MVAARVPRLGASTSGDCTKGAVVGAQPWDHVYHSLVHEVGHLPALRLAGSCLAATLRGFLPLHRGGPPGSHQRLLQYGAEISASRRLLRLDAVLPAQQYVVRIEASIGTILCRDRTLTQSL